MKEIPLTQGKVTSIDDDDFDKVSKYKWHTRKSCVKYKPTYYAQSQIRLNDKQVKLQMHRIIMSPANDMEIDHIDADGLNNQKSNLRIVTRRENLQNRHTKKTSVFPGVYYSYGRKRWRSSIRIKGVLIDLGSHLSEDAAYIIYKIACNGVD